MSLENGREPFKYYQGEKVKNYLENVSRALESCEWVELVDYFYMSSLEIRLDEGFVHWIHLYGDQIEGFRKVSSCLVA